MRRTRWIDFQKAKFAEVGDEDEAVLVEITAGLVFMSERVEVVFGGFDFDHASLWILER